VRRNRLRQAPRAMRTACTCEVLPIAWFVVPAILYEDWMTGEGRSWLRKRLPRAGPLGNRHRPGMRWRARLGAAARSGGCRDLVVADRRKSMPGVKEMIAAANAVVPKL